MKKKLLQAALIGSGSTALAAALWLGGILDPFENATWTLRVQQLAKPSPATDKIKLILIDQQSLDWAAKESELSWPWMRQAYNPILDFCRAAGAKVIAFDMLYTEPGDVADDETFGAKIGERKDFVVAAFFSDRAAQTNLWPDAIPRPAWKFDGDARAWPAPVGASFPIRQVASNAAMLSSVAEQPDPDSLYRRVTPMRVFDGQPVPMLGMAAWLNFQPLEKRTVTERNGALHIGTARLPLDAKKRVLLRFRGPSGTHESFRAAAVIRSQLQIEAGEKPELDPAELKDCFVFFGVSAPGLKDLKSTPAGADYPGVEIHATFLDNLLEDELMRDVPALPALALVLLLAIAFTFATLRCRNGIQTALVFAASTALFIALGFGAYHFGWWWPMIFTFFSLLVGQIAAVVLNYLTEGKQKRFIQGAFKQYLSGEVVDQLVENPGALKLGGEKRELTMFFSDLKGFSTFSEKLEPQALTALMNEVLSDACDIIMEGEGGTLDKFIGDAIVAFWNAPVSQQDHALRAVCSAIKIQRHLTARADEFKAKAGGIPVIMRIGLNTGEVVVGNMGSRQRFNYTMLGDAANLASRLEGANKAFGTHIMVAEPTWNLLGGAVPGREIGLVRVIGRAAPVKVFEPLGLPGDPFPSELEGYAKAIQLVREKKWAEAYELFEDITGDPLAEKYAAHCLALRDGKLPDWDGVWNLTEK